MPTLPTRHSPDARWDAKYPLRARTLNSRFRNRTSSGRQPAAPAAVQPSAQPATSLPVAPPAVAPTPGPAAENAAGAKEVEIYGQDGSWVIVSSDKGPSKEIYVKKGQRITVPFGEKIEIKLGNPSSVVFRYNGQETPVTTEKGGVKTIRFPQ